MTRLALISDIHGNAVALDAVLADLETHSVDEIVCLGDIVAGGPQPRQALARLRALDCPVVRGNTDDWVLGEVPPGGGEGTRRLAENAAWVRTQLAPADLRYLDSLPSTLSLKVDLITAFCFHGSPRASTDGLLATTPVDTLDGYLADAPAASLFAGGHTHLQLLRRHREMSLVNPGSVGVPLGSLVARAAPFPGWAEYALVDSKSDGLAITFLRLPVDPADIQAANEHTPYPCWASDLERRIRRWLAQTVEQS
jgi:putative phosphoesterase